MDPNCPNLAPHAAHDWLDSDPIDGSPIEYECRGVALPIVEWPENASPVPLGWTERSDGSDAADPVDIQSVVSERTSTHEQAPPYPVQRPYDWDQHRCARSGCTADRLLSHAAWHEHMLRLHRLGGIPINCEGITCEGAWPVASDEEKRALSDYLRLMLTDTKWDSRALYEELVYLRRKYQHIMDYPKPQPSSAGSPSTRRRD